MKRVSISVVAASLILAAAVALPAQTTTPTTPRAPAGTAASASGMQVPTPGRLVAVAPRPPMGWNSYDYHNWTVNEAEVLANARWLAEHLASYGWEYVVVDFLWSMPMHGDYEQRQLDAAGNPRFRLAMDRSSRLVPDPARFPSAANGVGFRALGDSIHALGLRFGIHLMRGIPRQAVHEHAAILGTPYTADQVADTSSVCRWNDNMYGLDMSKPGAQDYLDSLFRLYAEWGVDYVKVDDILRPFHTAEIAGYSLAIERSGRPMVLSLSLGPVPVEQADFLTTHANMWRVTSDAWDNWRTLQSGFRYGEEWAGHTRPGTWPDLDMLPLGQLAARYPLAERGTFNELDRPSRLTHDEQRTMMNLWAIYRSPLIMGGNLPDNDAWTTSLLTNRAVLDVNQHGRNPRLVRAGEYPVYASDAPTGGDRYVALFNTTEAPATVSVPLAEVGLQRARPVDLWTGDELATANTEISAQLAPHASVLLRLRAQ